MREETELRRDCWEVRRNWKTTSRIGASLSRIGGLDKPTQQKQVTRTSSNGGIADSVLSTVTGLECNALKSSYVFVCDCLFWMLRKISSS